MNMSKIDLGDCFDVMRGMPDASVDMMLTDPPYGMSYQSNRRAKGFDRIVGDSSLDWIDDFVSESHRVMKSNTAAYIFCSWHNVDVFKASVERHFRLKNILVWVKNNHGSGDLKGAYAPKHEFILFAHKGRVLLRDGRRPDILEFPKVSGRVMRHPTQKPVQLLERLILDASDSGDVVFDPFMGSGSTGVAALGLGRRFRGIEMDGEYFYTADERLNAV